MGRWNVCKYVSLGLAPVLIILGACLKWAIFPAVVESMVSGYLQLTPSNKETWDAWISPPIVPYMKFTFFNVENVEDIKNRATPRVTEVGQMAFQEIRRKESILSIHDEISFGSYIHYEYDQEASDIDPTQPVTIVNPVMAIVNAMLEELKISLHFDELGLGFKCDEICGILPEFELHGDFICKNLPPRDYPIPCNLVPFDELPFDENACSKDGTLQIEYRCETLNHATKSYEDCAFWLKLNGEDAIGPIDCMTTLGPLLIMYKDGNFTIDLAGLIHQDIPCQDLIGPMIDCEDPLKIWPLIEKALLNPLKSLVNHCENPQPSPTTTVAPTILADTTEAPTTTNPRPTMPPMGACDDIDFDDVPPECFCDSLTMTDLPTKIMFTGAHSGVLLAVHHVLEHFNLTIHVPDIITIIDPYAHDIPIFKDFDLAKYIDKLLENMGLGIIDLKHGKFGFFRQPHDTNATRSWWKINNGKYNMAEYNTVIEFNGKTQLPDSWWDSFGPTPSAHKAGVPGICHDITGTDGLSFAPPISKEDDVWLFNDQLCRSIWLSYDKEADVDGVTTYQFTPRPEVFSMSNPNNLCYCPQNLKKCAKPSEDEEDAWDMSDCKNKTYRGNYACLDGMLNLQGCQGAPVILSTPHFLDGDPTLPKAIDGVDPVREKHITYLNIEPTTGLPIIAHKRIQLNVPIVANKYLFDHYNLLDDIIFPVVWLDEGADIDEENLDKMKSMLVTPFILVDAFSGILIGLGGVLIILAGGLAFFCRGR